MLRGIYSAASAMNLSMQKMNLFAQNLSNSQTSGYKKKTYSVHSFEDMMVQLPDVQKAKKRNEEMPIATGSYIDGAGVKQAQGRLRQTGNALDLAVKGEGLYFQLEVNKGQQQGGEKSYTTTRDGRFLINENNFLVNYNGDYVLDTEGQRIRLMAKNPDTRSPVQNPNREASLPLNAIRVDEKGQIWGTLQGDDPRNQPAPRVLATLRLVPYNADPAQPDDRAEMMAIMKKYGLELNRDSELLNNERNIPGAEPEGPANKQVVPQGTIHQGYLEESNVDITSEMIMMMMTSKDYDMSQKIISTEDKVLDKTINEMGRLQ